MTAIERASLPWLSPSAFQCLRQESCRSWTKQHVDTPVDDQSVESARKQQQQQQTTLCFRHALGPNAKNARKQCKLTSCLNVQRSFKTTPDGLPKGISKPESLTSLSPRSTPCYNCSIRTQGQGLFAHTSKLSPQIQIPNLVLKLGTVKLFQCVTNLEHILSWFFVALHVDLRGVNGVLHVAKQKKEYQP